MPRSAAALLLGGFVVATPARATDALSIGCQRSIERGGTLYVRALLVAATHCAGRGSTTPLATCLASAVSAPPILHRRASWEASVARACAATDIVSELGYFPTCGGEPLACASAGSGVACLTCRAEERVRTAMVALFAGTPETDACHRALARPGVAILKAELWQLRSCFRSGSAASIAACLDAPRFRTFLEAKLAEWRSGAVATCAGRDPFASPGYPHLCAGVPPEGVGSCSRPARACNLSATSKLAAPRADDDLLDCLECHVEEAALAIGRDLFGANLCCTPAGCQFVRTRTSCRQLGGTPAYYENRPFTVQSSPQPASPHGVDVGLDGALYLVDSTNVVIRVPDPSGDGAAGTNITAGATYVFASGAAVDTAGNVFVATRCANRIYKVSPTGAISIFAGTGAAGHSGDGGPATDAAIAAPNRVAVDALGNVYFTESGVVSAFCGHAVSGAERVRMVDTRGTIHTIAGTAQAGTGGEGGPALAAQLVGPFTLWVDGDGGLLVAEYTSNRVVRIDGAGILTRVAGRPATDGGFSGDGGTALRARFHRIEGIRPGSTGELYLAEPGSGRIRLVDPLGSVITIAGTGERGNNVDFAPAVQSPMGFAADLALSPDGRVFFSDTCSTFGRNIRVLALVPF